MEITGGEIFLRFTIYRNQDFNHLENGTVNNGNGTVIAESGLVNQRNGTVNDKNGTVIVESMSANPRSGTVNNGNGTVNEKILTNKEALVIMQLRKNENITAQQLTQTTRIPLRTIKRILLKLTEKRLIQRVGSDKTGHWEVIG